MVAFCNGLEGCSRDRSRPGRIPRLFPDQAIDDKAFFGLELAGNLLSLGTIEAIRSADANPTPILHPLLPAFEIFAVGVVAGNRIVWSFLGAEIPPIGERERGRCHTPGTARPTAAGASVPLSAEESAVTD